MHRDHQLNNRHNHEIYKFNDNFLTYWYQIPGSFLFVHVIFHLVCLSLDPADPKIRQSKTTKATEFNRTQHKHVIENDHCYICQVDV